MRIKSIELEWFRGAADLVSLKPNCKSMVVYGANGSGKSSFVDAVEYVLNNGSIEHLKTEYSGSHQVNAIPNTHKSEASKTALRFKFKDDSELKIDFRQNGSSKSSGTQAIAMGEWEYRQTVLRQNEVSEFIHDTKGKKYSALLPLFGLHKMEVAADNLRKLVKSVETESRINQNETKLEQVENQRKDVFGTQSYAQIVKAIDDLYVQYFEASPTTDVELLICNDLATAIENRIKGYSADNQKYVFLKGVAEPNLQGRIDAVRASGVDLAESLEPQITEKLAILQSASTFVDGLDAPEIVDCPACGRAIQVDAFREHVKAERERLQEIQKAFNSYKAKIGDVCDTLRSIKSNLDKPDLQTWRDALGDSAITGGFNYLEGMDFSALRESCSDGDLTAVESNVLPLVRAAAQDSMDAPLGVQKLTTDKKLLEVAQSVIIAEPLKSEITRAGALVALINSLEEGVRSEIRKQSQMAIDNISEDIEGMWATLHPGETIESVRLSLPPDSDKAIDVVLKFHGLDQESRRLTLSEGYRNSLGLCIFLAMAKHVVDTERPLFLDDVVVSLDRNHRGMIQSLLEKEFNDRQVIILTHDREWYTELRHQLGDDNRWIFKTLLPYETPKIGIRWSHKTTTFDDARALIKKRPDAAGNDARRIMDVELSMIAERVHIRMPYLRSDKNDKRMAHEFLTRLIADGKKCFEKKSGKEYGVHTDALDTCNKADQLLLSWGNRASHTFDIVPSEASKLIETCESAIASFKCSSCKRYVWFLDAASPEWVQCQCGEIRWRYGKA
jgi:hypothetical protein